MALNLQKHKGLFGAPGYTNADYPDGIAAFYVQTIEHGITLSSTEGMARTTRSIYLRRRRLDNFSMTLRLTSYEEYLRCSNFFRGYIDYITNPESVYMKPMSVMYAPRNFWRWGIPSSAQAYGKKYGEFVWTVQVTFEGAIHPMTPDNTFTPAVHDKRQSKYFYPLGDLQGSTVDNIEVVKYDNPKNNERVNMPAIMRQLQKDVGNNPAQYFGGLG
jgi:hypothetical protein